MKSQSDVRAALVEFLTAATKILTIVTPALTEEMKEKYPTKVKREIHSKRPTPNVDEDDDYVPF